MPNSEFEYCKDCVSHASCYRNGYCVDMLCKPAVTEENIKALQQDNAALRMLLNKERDEWHAAFMRNNEEWYAKHSKVQEDAAYWRDKYEKEAAKVQAVADAPFFTPVSLYAHTKVCNERDELKQEFEAFKNTAAETETFLRKERDELYRQRENWIIERSTLRTQLETAEIERNQLDKDNRALWKRVDAAEQQCTLEAIDAPATYTFNTTINIPDHLTPDELRQMVRDEINRVFSRYGHSMNGMHR